MSKRIAVTLTEEEYGCYIKNIAARSGPNVSMADVIRNQLKSILDPSVNRLTSLAAKTCV